MLQSAFPHLQIAVSALEEPPSFNRDLYDLALFYVDREDSGQGAIILSDDELFPVCSPRLIAVEPLRGPSDLARHRLLHDRAWRDDWARWLRETGATDIDASLGTTFSLYSLAFRAAIDGSGVLIGRRTLVHDALRDGQLVAPFSERLPTRDRLALLLPSGQQMRPDTQALVHWFLKQGAAPAR